MERARADIGIAAVVDRALVIVDRTAAIIGRCVVSIGVAGGGDRKAGADGAGDGRAGKGRAASAMPVATAGVGGSRGDRGQRQHRGSGENGLAAGKLRKTVKHVLDPPWDLEWCLQTR